MIKLFVDTNVILDTVEPSRIATSGESTRIMQLVALQDHIRLCISMQSIGDVAYLGRKRVGKEGIKLKIREYMNRCKILPMNDMILYEALKLDCPDFEDALQIYCADHNCCDYIITNNKKHFSGYTDIPVYTPKEFLKKITTPSVSCT